MRLVRVGLTVQLCLRTDGGPVTHILSIIVVRVTEKGPRVQPGAVPAPGMGKLLCGESAEQLCPWAKLVRAMAACISLQP